MRRHPQRAALMLCAALPLPILVLGCASTSMLNRAQQIPTARPSVGFAIAQLGYDDSSYFAMCLPAACPVATPKTIAAALASAAPTNVDRDTPQSQAQVTMPDSVAVHFAHASVDLRPSDSTALVQLSAQARHAARITVVGTTDNAGSRAFNQRLAWQRAQAVAAFLRERLGVPPARIAVEGRGGCCYVADNATSAGRQANRRAVVTFHLAQEASP